MILAGEKIGHYLAVIACNTLVNCVLTLEAIRRAGKTETSVFYGELRLALAYTGVVSNV